MLVWTGSRFYESAPSFYIMSAATVYNFTQIKL